MRFNGELTSAEANKLSCIANCTVRKAKDRAIALIATLHRPEVKLIGIRILEQDKTDPISESYLDWAEEKKKKFP